MAVADLYQMVDKAQSTDFPVKLFAAVFGLGAQLL